MLAAFKYILLFPILIFLLGCSCPKGKIYSYNEAGLYSKNWQEVVKENPIGEDENIKATPLSKIKIQAILSSR